jgi:ATP-binding cassette subfamily C protein CydCD
VSAHSPTPRPARVLVRLVGLLGLSPARLALSVGLGALAVIAGAVLVGLAGYLICRAAEQPPILSLTTVMVAVRVAALTRPVARYAERLSSHDLAFRALGNLRARVLARIEPLAPAGLEGYRDGELLSRMVADIDQLQDLALRLLLPAGVAVVASTVVVGGVLVVSPAAGVLLGVGLAAAAVLGPLVAARVVTRSQRRQAALRARLTADLVDALDAADELWLNGADGRAAAAVADDDRALVQVALRDPVAPGRPTPSVSAPPPSPPWPSWPPPRPPPAGARSTRCWWRPSPWSRWARSRPCCPCRWRPASSPRCWPPAAGCWSWSTAGPRWPTRSGRPRPRPATSG